MKPFDHIDPLLTFDRKTNLKDNQTITEIRIKIIHMRFKTETVDEVSVRLFFTSFFDDNAWISHLLCWQIQSGIRIEQIGHEAVESTSFQSKPQEPTKTYAKFSRGFPLTTSSGVMCARALILSDSCNINSARRRRSFSQNQPMEGERERRKPFKTRGERDHRSQSTD